MLSMREVFSVSNPNPTESSQHKKEAPKGRWKDLVGLVIVVGLVGWLAYRGQNPKTNEANSASRILEPRKWDFELKSPTGPWKSSDHRGKALVLYFGFTTCPDVCPLSLNRLSGIVKGLSPHRQEKFLPVFVSVDTRKDTPQKAQEYAHFFFPNAIGLSGSKEQIDKVVDLFGAFYTYDEKPNSALGYTVNHSTRFFLVDEKGVFRGTVPSDGTADEIKARLLDLI
jgi:protein SCO1